MRKIRVGYLPLYIKLYDDNGQDRSPLVEHMNKLISALSERGLDVYPAEELCRTSDEFDRAVQRFNDLNVDAVITQHLSYSPSLESIGALLRLDAPIVVFDTTPDYQVLSLADRKNCIDDDHGIHGVQDMCCMLRKNGKPYTVCAGHAFHGNVTDRVVGACRAADEKFRDRMQKMLDKAKAADALTAQDGKTTGELVALANELVQAYGNLKGEKWLSDAKRKSLGIDARAQNFRAHAARKAARGRSGGSQKK